MTAFDRGCRLILRLRSSPDWLAAGGMLVLLAALHGRAVLSSDVFFERDILGYVFPEIEGLVRAVAEGGPPLWNPFLSFGVPVLGDPAYQAAYPLTWLNLLVNPGIYYKALVLIHGWAAGFGLFRLARSWGLTPLGAFVAGGGFMASGPLLSAANLNHHFAGAAWMPWVLWALERALAGSDRGAHLVLGATAAGQVLAGSGDMVIMTGLAAGARAAVYVLQAPESLSVRFRRALRTAVLALVFGACASAVQWLPTLDLVRASSRLGQSEGVSSYWSLHPASLIDLLVPTLVAGSPINAAVRTSVFEGRESFLVCLYVGVSLSLLGGLGALFPGWSKRTGAISGVIFFGLMALGRHTPVYPLVTGFTPLGILRYPVKYAVPATLYLSLLAGGGLDAWQRSWRTADERRKGIAVALVGVCLVILFFAAGELLRTCPDRLGAYLDVSRGPVPTLLGPLVEKLRQSAGIALLAVGLLLLRARRRDTSSLMTAAIAVLCLVDLVRVGRSVNPLAPAALASYRPAVVDEIRQSAAEPRIFSVSYSTDWLLKRLVRAPVGWNPEWAWALGSVERLQPPAASRWAIGGSFDGDFTGLTPAALGELTQLIRESEGSPLGIKLLVMGAVTHVVALHRAAFRTLPQVAEMPSVFADPVRVYRVPAPLPRAYVVEGVRIADGPAALLAIANDQFDPRREVILAQGTPHSATDGFQGTARILLRRSDRLAIEVAANRPAVLVVVEAYDRGWRAQVDGAAVEVSPANRLFRGVRIEAGRHRVEMVYRPTAVSIGFGFSAAAWGWLGLLLARGRDRRRFDPGGRPRIASLQ